MLTFLYVWGDAPVCVFLKINSHQKGNWDYQLKAVYTIGILKAYRDWYSIMKTAKQKSRAEGLAEGKKTIALDMKAEGINDALIAKMTGLSIDDINRL